MFSLKLRCVQRFSLVQGMAVPVLLAALLAGCDQQPGTTEKDKAASAPAAAASRIPPAPAPVPPKTEQEKAVMKRAQERWDALIAHDFERAWTYLEASERATVTQENYKHRFGQAGAWQQVSVHRVVCGTKRCAARIRLVTLAAVPGLPKNMPPLVSFFDEEWRLEEGEWYHRDGARRGQDTSGEEPLPSAADPIVPASRPASSVLGELGGNNAR